MRDDNLFRLNLQSRHTESVKADGAEVETAIWNDAVVEVFQGGYKANHCDPLFRHLRNIIANRFKNNVAIRFVRYMVEAYGTSRSVCQGYRRKEGERDLEKGLEALE